MASIMKNFLRTSSNLSTEAYSERPQQLNRTESKMAHTPSFNDLSCGASRDGASY